VADLMQVVGTDTYSLAPLCALVELSDLGLAPTIAEPPFQALSRVAAQSVLFSSGWMFLLPRILGVAASVNRRWDEAEGHFQAAIAVASSSKARPELGRTYLDYARMQGARSKRGACSVRPSIRPSVSAPGPGPARSSSPTLSDNLLRAKASPLSAVAVSASGASPNASVCMKCRGRVHMCSDAVDLLCL
jgi:hypothetical protein